HPTLSSLFPYATRFRSTQAFGNWRLSSTMALDYLEQTRAATDEPVPQTIGSGKVSIRPELSYRLNVDGSAFIEPKAAISSFWDIDRKSTRLNSSHVKIS